MKEIHLRSSAISRLLVDEDNKLAQVQFINGKEYTYFDVALDAIKEVLNTTDSDFSIGKWVNNNLLKTKKEFTLGFVNYL